jgi:tetratricopeptide (TPR) repeat protein
MADRYTYFPLVGLFVVVVWGASDLSGRWRIAPPLLAAGALGVLAALAVQTRAQVGFWQSSEKLYRHTLDVMPDNSFAHSALATALLLDDRSDEAEVHLRRAVEIDPKNSEALVPLAGLLLDRGDVEQAAALAGRAVAVAPRSVEARLNLAFALERQGDLDGAIQHYQHAVQLEPQRPGLQLLLGRALEERGDARGALAHYQLELALEPDSEDAREGLLRVRRSLRAAAAPAANGGAATSHSPSQPAVAAQ